MRLNARDVNAVADYGVNAIAFGLLPLGLLGLAAGVVLLAIGERDAILPGVAGTAVGVAILAYAAYRNLAPSKPLLELAPQGALMRIPGATEFRVPWTEVRDIGVLDITVDGIPTRRGSTSARYDNVTTLIVSRAFYDRVVHLDSAFMRGPGWNATFIPEGEEAVQIALHHEFLRAPVDELREAVRLRWLAFGEAKDRGATARAPVVRHVAADGSSKRRSIVVTHGAAPLMTALGVIGLIVAALDFFQIWPFDAERRRAQEEERRARQWAATERRIEDERRRIDQTFQQMREEARRRAEAEEQEARLRARRVEEIEARERAELLAGGPLPPPSATRIDGHRGAALALAAARNERSFVSGGADGAVKLWDTRAAVALRDVGKHAAPVRAVIILSDGRSALAGDDRGAIVWRALPEGETLHAFDAAQAGGVRALAVDGQGQRLISLHESGAVIVWDLTLKTRVATLAAEGARPRALALSADGRRAVTGGEDGALRIWDVAGARLERTFAGHAGPIRSVALTPDGQRAVSGGEDATARLWDLAAGAETRRFQGHAQVILGAAIDAAGARVATVSADGTARLWDAASGVELRRFESVKGPFHAVTMLAHGRFAVGADDGAIRLFDAEGREPMRYFPSLNR